MKILNNKTPQQIIFEQKSFTDQVHTALLITEHGDQPNGLGSSIELSKNQKLKKVIEEIYGALLDGRLKTNEALFEKIFEIIKDKNFKGIEILKTNLDFALNTLNNGGKELKRFPETKKQSSKIKDTINDFLKVLNPQTLNIDHAQNTFIGFKKIQKSNQKRNKNHSGFLKHSIPWLIKKTSKGEFENHSFISKIWNTNNEISKIRETENKTLFAIKFFENSTSLQKLMVNLDEDYSENLKFSEESLDNLIFGFIFHPDLFRHNHNIIVQFNQNSLIDLKLIDFEDVDQVNIDKNIYRKDFFKDFLMQGGFYENIKENFFVTNAILLCQNRNLNNLNKDFLWNLIKNQEINSSDFTDFNKNHNSFLKYNESDIENKTFADFFSIEGVISFYSKINQDEIKNKNSETLKEEEKEIIILQSTIKNLGLLSGYNHLYSMVNREYDQKTSFYMNFCNPNDFYDISFSIKYTLELIDKDISINEFTYRGNNGYQNYLIEEKEKFNKKSHEEKVKDLKEIIEKQIEFSKKYFLEDLQRYLFAKNFQENYVSPERILQSLKKIKKKIFQSPGKLGLKTKEEKTKLSEMQKNFIEFTKNLYKKQIKKDEKNQINLNEDQLKELKNLIPTKFSSKIITHLSLTILSSASAFACCLTLKKFDDHLTKTKLLLTATISFIVSFVLIEIFSKLIDLEPKIDELTDFIFQIDIDKLI